MMILFIITSVIQHKYFQNMARERRTKEIRISSTSGCENFCLFKMFLIVRFIFCSLFLSLSRRHFPNVLISYNNICVRFEGSIGVTRSSFAYTHMKRCAILFIFVFSAKQWPLLGIVVSNLKSKWQKSGLRHKVELLSWGAKIIIYESFTFQSFRPLWISNFYHYHLPKIMQWNVRHTPPKCFKIEAQNNNLSEENLTMASC